MNIALTSEMKSAMRISYALRRVPQERFASFSPCSDRPQPGDLALAELQSIGRNASLELQDGRRCALHEGDLLAVVFGNRYATLQFEGYSRTDGDRCDLLSMGGLCGIVESKHAKAADPSKLRILGLLRDADGRPLRLRDFAVAPFHAGHLPHIIVVCGTSMDSGKTHTAVSLIMGLRRQGHRVAGLKLTGTATGKDTWSMLDAGACAALDFVDGGFPSTYLCTLDELLKLFNLLLAQAASNGAGCVVVEIADGLLQNETAALLQSSRFTRSVHSWVFASGDPLAAAGGIRVLRGWGIKPLAISGVVSMSPLGVKETTAATGIPCLTAHALQRGELNAELMELLPAAASAGATVDVLRCP